MLLLAYLPTDCFYVDAKPCGICVLLSKIWCLNFPHKVSKCAVSSGTNGIKIDAQMTTESQGKINLRPHGDRMGIVDFSI